MIHVLLAEGSAAVAFCVIIACIGAIFFVNALSKMWDDADERKAKERKRQEEERRIEVQRKADEESRKRREVARLRDIRLKQAMEELENGTYDRVIWAKALIMADGSQSKARALYLQLRIGEL